MTVIISGDNGVSDVDGSAGTPAIRGTDANTGIFFGADQVGVATNGVERVEFGNSETVFNDGGASVDFRVEGDTDANLLFVDASTDRVGIGTNSPGTALQLGDSSSGTKKLRIHRGAGADYTDIFSDTGSTIIETVGGGNTTFRMSGTDRALITAAGDFVVGKTSSDISTAGGYITSAGEAVFTVNANPSLYVNRLTNDGALVNFYQATTLEGNISVSGSTVSYNGGHLARWAQMLTKPDLLKGTVMSNLDEMNVYVKPTLYWTEDDELPVDEEGNPTVAVGDVKQETSVSDNEQLNKVKVSDVEGDANVAGVFVNWTYDEAHQVDEINMAMTGDMIIRIAQGVTVQRGDLLMSAGDGTAMPQGDDIVRSKTIAKVTSTHVTCTYDDGSYCVPCVLMAC
jgi:hypothetical protein